MVTTMPKFERKAKPSLVETRVQEEYRAHNLVPVSSSAYEFHSIVKSPYGLHPSPLAKFHEIAEKYECRVEVGKNGDAKQSLSHVLAILMMEFQTGSPISISVDGNRARECAKELIDYLDAGFGEIARN